MRHNAWHKENKKKKKKKQNAEKRKARKQEKMKEYIPPPEKKRKVTKNPDTDTLNLGEWKNKFKSKETNSEKK